MSKEIAIDANLLVLLIVGLTKPEYISAHKALKAYSIKDFNTLKSVLSAATNIIVNPNIMSEASNFLDRIGPPAHTEIFKTFAQFCRQTPEIYIPSSTASKHPTFARLGLADVVMLNMVETGATLLTVDLDLYLAALGAGRKAINFRHLTDNLP